MPEKTKLLVSLGVALALAGAASTASAAPVPLQNATATFSQSNPCCGDIWSPRYTIDGQRSGSFVSWAPNRGDPPDFTLPETIVWETKSDLAVNTGRPPEFGIWQEDFVPRPGHNLGRFRLSYTTYDRSLFADGLATGGDVSANWTVIDPLTARSSTGESFTELADKSLLVSGGANTYSDYFVTAAFAATGVVTGFRLEGAGRSFIAVQRARALRPRGVLSRL